VKGYRKIKTEHAGSKKGRGAWWGARQEAKKVSRKARRAAGKVAIKEALRG